VPSIQFTVPHQLEPDDVVVRLKAFLAKLRERNEPKFQVKTEEWSDRHLKTTFSSYGFSMDAAMDVEPNGLKFNVNIPFAAIVFKGQIEQRLRDEMTKLLS
jgi:hypothetical protein